MLWGRSHFKNATPTMEPDPRFFEDDVAIDNRPDSSAGNSGFGGVPRAFVLLTARLQGAVMLGRAPAVSRALTATVPGGGEWMLPRAEQIQASNPCFFRFCFLRPILSLFFRSAVSDNCGYVEGVLVGFDWCALRL